MKSLVDSINTNITLNAQERDIVSTLFKEKTYQKGDFFLAEGQIGMKKMTCTYLTREEMKF